MMSQLQLRKVKGPVTRNHSETPGKSKMKQAHASLRQFKDFAETYHFNELKITDGNLQWSRPREIPIGDKSTDILNHFYDHMFLTSKVDTGALEYYSHSTWEKYSKAVKEEFTKEVKKRKAELLATSNSETPTVPASSASNHTMIFQQLENYKSVLECVDLEWKTAKRNYELKFSNLTDNSEDEVGTLADIKYINLVLWMQSSEAFTAMVLDQVFCGRISEVS
jgi:hypothetical protein